MKVGELEKEVEKQKEMKGMYRLKLERTEDYLRNCLQVAQDNGLLDIIINKKDNNIIINDNNKTNNNNQQEFLISPPPQLSAPLHHHSDLSALVDLANINGWYIHPNEVPYIHYFMDICLFFLIRHSAYIMRLHAFFLWISKLVSIKF